MQHIESYLNPKDGEKTDFRFYYYKYDIYKNLNISIAYLLTNKSIRTPKHEIMSEEIKSHNKDKRGSLLILL